MLRVVEKKFEAKICFFLQLSNQKGTFAKKLGRFYKLGRVDFGDYFV